MRHAPDPTSRSARTRPPGMWTAVAVSAVIVIVGGLLLVHPPGQHGIPLCVTKALTGLDCPFCGGLRAVSALLRGDPVTAADHNLLVLVLAPIVMTWWIRRVLAERRGRPIPGTRRGIGAAIVVVIVLFTLVRNLPFGAWLASGTG